MSTRGPVTRGLAGRSLQAFRERPAMRTGRVMPTALETGRMVAAPLAHLPMGATPFRVRLPTAAV